MRLNNAFCFSGSDKIYTQLGIIKFNVGAFFTLFRIENQCSWNRETLETALLSKYESLIFLSGEPYEINYVLG